MDAFSSLLPQLGLTASVFHSGPLCSIAQFQADRPEGHLHLLRKGRVRLREVNQTDLIVSEPTLLFFARPVRHSLTPVGDVEVDILCASIEFRGRSDSMLASIPGRVIAPLQAIPEIGRSLELMFDEAFRHGLGRQAIIDRLCEVVIIQLVRWMVASRQIQEGLLGGLADKRISKAIMAIHHEPFRRLTLHDLAGISAMSRSSFSAAFRHAVGTSPGDYLTHVRMAHAQELLKRGTPINLVAHEIGFNGQPAFTRAFTKCFGMAPRVWARRSREV